jgi:hypothetical protein
VTFSQHLSTGVDVNSVDAESTVTAKRLNPRLDLRPSVHPIDRCQVGVCTSHLCEPTHYEL